MEKWKHSHFSSQQIECEIPIRKCDDFWTIKLAVFVVSLNSEGKSMRSDQYLKSSGWTRSLSTLFASFHFIHGQLFVGGFLSNKIFAETFLLSYVVRRRWPKALSPPCTYLRTIHTLSMDTSASKGMPVLWQRWLSRARTKAKETSRTRDKGFPRETAGSRPSNDCSRSIFLN